MRCGVVSALSRSWGHVCGFLRGVERIGARELEVQDSVERERFDEIRISVVCAGGYRSGCISQAEREDAVLRKVKSWNNAGPCFRCNNLVE